MSSAPRSLITGGSGFIGANLVRHLLDRGHEVHLLLRSSHQAWRLTDVQPRLQIHAVDLLDAEGLRAACKSVRPTYVFHLAAAGQYSWQTDTDQIIATNVTATAHLLDAAKDADAFIHAGSSSEYGFKDHPPTEMEALEPNSIYSVTKAAATHLCRMTALRDRRRVITLRLYSAYGPFEEPNRLIPTLLVNGIEQRYPPLVAPETARDFVYVDDLCKAFLDSATHAGANPTGIYNVGSGVQTTLQQTVEAVRPLFQIKHEPRWSTMPNRTWDTTCWVSDPALIAKEMGWLATTPFAEGLAKTRDWLMADPARLQHYRAAIRKS